MVRTFLTNMTTRKNPRALGLVLLGVLGMLGLLVAGCEKQSAPAGALPQAGPPEVSVFTVKAEPVSLTSQLSGRVAASLIAEVRPQVGGIVLKRLFKEGSDVKEGDVLYQIDPARYEATLSGAEADLLKAEGRSASAQIKGRRMTELKKDDAVSGQDFDDAMSALKVTAADIDLYKSAVETARINLQYTKITAPISGRIGRSSITDGALVTASQATPLATIQMLDPVYVDITQSSAAMLELRSALDSGQIKNADGETRVRLILDDGSPYAEEGVLKFTEAFVNETTGSVTLRTSFPNQHLTLLPGMFVRAILEEGVKEDGILVPQRGVTRDPAGNAVVMIVNAENIVEQRIITAARTVGNSWLISNGLAPGDRVILEGLQRARPGSPVTTVPFADAPAVPPAGK